MRGTPLKYEASERAQIIEAASSTCNRFVVVSSGSGTRTDWEARWDQRAIERRLAACIAFVLLDSLPLRIANRVMLLHRRALAGCQVEFPK